MKKIIIGILLFIVFGVIAYPYYLAHSFKSKVGKAKTPEALLELVDEESLKESVASSLKAVFEEQVKKDPMAGMAMAFLEPMTKMMAEMMLSPEGLEALLKGASVKQIQQKAKDIEEDTWQWAYFTGFNSFSVATEEVDFNFEKQDGSWVLKTVAFKVDEEQQPDKKPETTTKVYQADGSVKEINDSEKYGKAKYVKDKVPFEQAREEDFLKGFLKNHFFIDSLFDDKLVVVNDFKALPFNVGYKVSWDKVETKDQENILKTSLTARKEKRINEQAQEFQGLNFFGRSQNSVYVEEGNKVIDIINMEGRATFHFPSDWERFEFELTDTGNTLKQAGIELTVTQTSEHRADIRYVYPKEYYEHDFLVTFYDNEGRVLKSEDKTNSKSGGETHVKGRKHCIFYGKPESVVVFFPKKYVEFETTIQPHVKKYVESLEDLGVISVERYGSDGYSEQDYVNVDVDDFKDAIQISSYRGSDPWSFNRPGLKIETSKLDNNTLAKVKTNKLQLMLSDGGMANVSYQQARHSNGFEIEARSGFGDEEHPVGIDKFSGTIVIEYPATIERVRYANGDSLPELTWYPSALSYNKKRHKNWIQLKAFNKDGVELKKLSNAISHSWELEQQVFWGEIAYIEVEKVQKYEDIIVDIDHDIPELLDEKCKDSNDC